jgi:cellulose synthase/poly-beta-1,6-N-acetylglucosamine synthase-like glycosyltransferase
LLSVQDVYYPPVSIVIAIKNEELVLSSLITAIANQDYPTYEIVFVDDHSSDNSKTIIDHLAGQYASIRLIEQETDEHGKKRALERGINAAAYEWIVLTDADCRPASPKWLASLLGDARHKDMILGYSPYTLDMGSTLSRLISYEAFWIAIRYLEAAQQGRAYMGVGRNMAFKKELFHSVNGYTSHSNLLSGNDDLFVQQVDDKSKIGIATAPSSVMWSSPVTSFGDFFRQKKRHISTATRYQLRDQLKLLAEHIAHFGVYFIPILCAIYLSNISYLMLIFIYALAHYFILRPLLKQFQMSRLSWHVSYLDSFLLIFYMILALNPAKKMDRW